MILEVATLDVIPGREAEFELAFREARTVIAASHGFLGLDLRRCVERPSAYLLLVRWESVEDHEIGFRQGPHYPRWKQLLHHFYDPFPTVEHYAPVPGAEAGR
ncbi:antibiotic biosynthesis monooxygenase [Solihabitans fulvus]|uniref:Antibiotic biosynthesis monooxygenase n=1 Tax=Solihabitans fulvus TaxID=1892852 RepID=A0A5B2XT06_9PSEU|nr:antibiotic biosynthesis monooxygenase [Solihabitans fulvus]KAA2266493.1 antibiotic biosynthesis monooxygenase [Solihabitans fulvus]